ncbi:uncharacterized protein B0T15DRAFT_511304 [Chaetomium strumarium]|uniref:C2H2-type domain-containing protein n=1 Tax=Chaetomium strumarium TaxID=1170767 RepID=A0AAJ0GSN4_9PEZI|nr:hypothetical protein B0T15DRAFT_511304 [Chaetomium strumarium]
MSWYSHHSGAAVEVSSSQDDLWAGPSNMERSTSQSTSRTADSSYTATSYSSGCYSTGYSSAGPSPITDGVLLEHTQSAYPTSYPEAHDTAHLLSALGAQYHHAGQQLPQELQFCSPLQHFDGRMGSIEDAARQATEIARSLIANERALGPYELGVVTFQAVEEARQRLEKQGLEASPRAAVQRVVYELLHRQLNDADGCYTDANLVLEEAAYQLQVQVQGEEALDICYLAIVSVLAELRADLEAECYGPSTSTSTNTSMSTAETSSFHPTTSVARPSAQKERYRCRHPGCRAGASRPADLERHYKVRHEEEDKKTKYFCDYKRCSRHKTPFFRQDHFRDHLRTYHQEDLLRRGNKGDKKWWDSRAPHAVNEGWWRCGRCLGRVRQAKHGFVCPGCGSPCESERQRYRLDGKV